MAFFHDGRQGGGGDPYLKWTTKNNPGFAIRGVFPPVNAGVGETLFVFDFPTTAAAWAKFDSNKLYVVAWPYRTPSIARPSTSHKKAVVFQTLVLGHTGILRWVVDAEYAMNRMGNYFTQYEGYPEALAGKLPVYRYIGNDPHTKPEYASDTFYAPRFEIVDWMERPEDFGEPTVPPPAPMLPESETPVALPKPTYVPPPAPDNDAAAAAPFAGGQPYRPIATPTPIPAPTPSAAPAAPAATDLLAKYVRRQG